MLDPRTFNDLINGDTVRTFADHYFQILTSSILKIDLTSVERAVDRLNQCINTESHVFVGGNGGSCAIADHLCCDWMKGTHANPFPPLRVVSLSANGPLLTALANDFGYALGFSKQLEMLARPNDVVVLISSSGNSANIVEAARMAKQLKLTLIGLTGFTGGALRELADLSLHVPSSNYGIVEDTHQMIMHIIGQFIWKKRQAQLEHETRN